MITLRLKDRRLETPMLYGRLPPDLSNDRFANRNQPGAKALADVTFEQRREADETNEGEQPIHHNFVRGASFRIEYLTRLIGSRKILNAKPLVISLGQHILRFGDQATVKPSPSATPLKTFVLT
jgi:hypothetical protein